MRNRLLLVLGVLALALVAFCAFVAMQPSEMKVSRSATMAAPPDEVFAQVNNFHNWQQWSPWAKLDPDASTTFSGPESGEGAKFAWDGNDQVGAGNMTIVASKPAEQIDIKLEFTKPMEGTSDTLFTFTPAGDQTNVTWTTSSQNNFFGKLACLFIDIDQKLGAEFDKGLGSIKALVEAPPADAPPPASAPYADAPESSPTDPSPGSN